MKNPIWITVDNGDLFEGHQGHWANCFFSNATEAAIRESLDDGSLFGEVSYEIREMTDQEVQRCPEAVAEQQRLIAKYGEC